MKNKIKTVFISSLMIIFTACEKDNYMAPKTELSGQIVYQGEPIGVEFNQVRMQLWQPGFGKLAAIDAPIAQDGSYSAVLFDGNYKLVFPANEGPFKTITKDATSKDTVFVNLNGNQKLDIEVLPYYMIRDAQFSSSEKKVNATFMLDKIITGVDAREVERASLYISKTMFVSRSNNIAVKEIAGGDIKDLSKINISTDIPSITPAQNYVFARVGVKIKGVEDMIFSQVEQLQY